ncbi:hypothetical protein BU17DRAFT_90273 [Hysterangium stoloniferum]|nr:hypothetical protein BU17DRAFT_90273 [Hysterangium stoloniferum]
MGHFARYSSIQSQLRQLTQVINDVLESPRDSLYAYDEQAKLEKLLVDLDTVYNSAKLVLKSHHNQLSLINKLPDELLQIIFTHAFNDKAKMPMFQYMHLTWVCRRWRSLALDCAELWTFLNLDCRNYLLIREWLFRSKFAKLSVTQGTLENVDHDAVGQEIVMLEQLIGPQLWRVESLSLRINARRLKDIRHFLQQEAPSLTHLHFSRAVEVVPWVPTNQHTVGTTVSSVKLPKLFNGVAQLHSLSFEMPSIPPWDDFIPLMQDLRELRVVTIPQDYYRKCSAPERLLSILPSCPSLETLDFKSTSDGETVAALRVTTPSVSMPNLRRVTLRSDRDVRILPHIDMPCLQHLSLHLEQRNPRALESLIGSISSGFDLASLKEVIINGNGDVSGTTEGLEHTPPCLGSRRKLLSVFIPQRGFSNSFTPALLSVSRNISCLILRGHMHGGPPPGTHTLKQMISGAKGLTHLVIAWPAAASSLLKILEDPLILPNLMKVTCVGCGTSLEAQLLACAQQRPLSPLKEVDIIDSPLLSKFFLKVMGELGIKVLARAWDPRWKATYYGTAGDCS